MNLWPHIKTKGIALVGVAVFLFFNVPLPFLFGPLFACLVAALMGVRLTALAPLNDAMRTILGVAVGTTITVAFVHTLIGLWATLLLIPLMVVLIGLIGVPYFQRLWGVRLGHQLLRRDAGRPPRHADLWRGGWGQCSRHVAYSRHLRAGYRLRAPLPFAVHLEFRPVKSTWPSR